MGEMLIFDYLNKDTVNAHVEVNLKTHEVVCIEYTDFLPHQFLGKRPHTIDSVNDALEARCFESTHHHRDRLLRQLGLQQYNPLDIVRITHGVMLHDFNWIRFADENLKYEDVMVK